MVRFTGCLLIGVLCQFSFADAVHFNQHIRPIFAEHCFECHGPDAEKREADLRLDVALPNDHDLVRDLTSDNELLQRITSTDADERMPPASHDRLSEKQIELIRRWISAGAKYERHWAFEPIKDPSLPKLSTNTDGHTDIDRFIDARLRSKGLTRSPQITPRRQLIRRATLNLTGLPPTWAEVTAFESDPSRNAFEKVIDRLLNSQAYGERWGRHWLDLARYADTHGGAAIGFTKFPFSYTYRDYVIAAFNADLPYDRFLIEQLAADQLGLPANSPELAGLGFLTIGMQHRSRHDIIDDHIDVVTRGLMGLTVACARCHDHKYDAITAEDYYSLYATFASSSPPELLPVIGNPDPSDAYKSYESTLQKLQVAREDMARDQNRVMRGRLKMQVGMYLREIIKGTPEQDLSAAFLSFRTDDLRPHVLHRWQAYLETMSEQDPVWGPWLQLAKLDKKHADAEVAKQASEFAKQATSLIANLQKQNGDFNLPEPVNFSTDAPRWNPRVLKSLAEKKPKNLFEVADAYGDLFGKVHLEWLQDLMETASEAIPGTKPIPDAHAKHNRVNNPVNRQLRRHLYGPDTPTNTPEQLSEKILNRPINDNVKGRANAIQNLHLNSPGSPARAMALKEESLSGPFHLFRRGNPIDRAQVVQARFLSALGGTNQEPFPAGKRRLALAKKLVDPKNPLTRRVIVNWVWQRHFGKGLVRTPDDFGTRGERPTHPELLDYLANRLVDDGWSLKKLHRRIMLSKVYQQASAESPTDRIQDPDNRLLWRMPRRRLDFEAMRDSMLAASGELDTKIGGRPFQLLSSPVVPRRSIYAFINRDIVAPVLSTFDAADPNACTASRPETNVPQQTLFALNSNFIQDRSIALASLALKDDSSSSQMTDEQRIKRMYRRTLARDPDSDELSIAIQFLRRKSAATGKTDVAPDAATLKKRWQQLAHVLFASNEFVFVD